MTRVNVGIDPTELCDQMLLAELRELPRCYKHRTDAGPEHFTLGKGHVLWCARNLWSLWCRHTLLWKEAQRRGFAVQTPQKPTNPQVPWELWSSADVATARPLLIARIRERLKAMKRKPRWTNTTPPEWTT
jgi:hypothetical protein